MRWDAFRAARVVMHPRSAELSQEAQTSVRGVTRNAVDHTARALRPTADSATVHWASPATVAISKAARQTRLQEEALVTSVTLCAARVTVVALAQMAARVRVTLAVVPRLLVAAAPKALT